MKVAITVVAIIGALKVVHFLFPPILIQGESMYPTYKHGELIFGRRVFRSIAENDVVVFKNPYPTSKKRALNIKRIKEIRKGMMFVEGDNSECSYDSRSYGFIPKTCVVAKVIKARPRKESSNV